MSIPQFFTDSEMAKFRDGSTLNHSGNNRLFIDVADERHPFLGTQTRKDLLANPSSNPGIHRLILEDQIFQCTEMVRPVPNVPLLQANDTKALFNCWRSHNLLISSFLSVSLENHQKTAKASKSGRYMERAF